jgi:hypothetical protein
MRAVHDLLGTHVGLALLICILPGAAVLESEELEPPPFVGEWGRFGAGPGEFNTPVGIAVDPLGHVYVADRANHRIQKFDPDGRFLRTWGTYGSGEGELSDPFGIAVDPAGYIYVSEISGNRIQKFDLDGRFIAMWGSAGTGDGQFRGASGVALDAAGNLYVADQSNNRIQKFDRLGMFLLKWGAFGTADGMFSLPIGLAVDAAGHVYVSDQGHRVQKFTAEGGFLTKWGSQGSGEGQFSQTFGAAVDGRGHVLVTDRFNHRVQQFSGSGVFVTAWGSLGSAPGQFIQPGGVAVGPWNRIYVVDRFNHRVQRFGGASQPVVANAGPDQVVECTGPGLTSVSLDGTGTANPPEGLLFTWTLSGAWLGTGSRVSVGLPIGRHVVTLTVSEPGGTSDSDEVMVDVLDSTPPVIERATADPAVLWPPNGQMVTVETDTLVWDLCDQAPTCRITGVTSNEAVRDAEPDWEIVADSRVRLRADRVGQGDGRVYTLWLSCEDAHGNRTTRSTTVEVPKRHDPKK